MGSIRRELTLALEGGLDSIKHGVEGACQPADLIPGISGINPTREVLRFNLGGQIGDSNHWIESPPSDPNPTSTDQYEDEGT